MIVQKIMAAVLAAALIFAGMVVVKFLVLSSDKPPPQLEPDSNMPPAKPYEGTVTAGPHTINLKDDSETPAQRAIRTYDEWRRLDNLARDEKTPLRQQADAAFNEYLAADAALRKEAANGGQ